MYMSVCIFVFLQLATRWREFAIKELELELVNTHEYFFAGKIMREREQNCSYSEM